MKIELKHLVPYLPYKVLGKSQLGTIFELCTYSNMSGSGVDKRTIDTFINDNYKLILRPLSDLVKEIDINGEKFIPMDGLESDPEIEYFADGGVPMKYFKKCEIWELKLLPYGIIENLFKWHFDVFELIEKGLAIDINTL